MKIRIGTRGSALALAQANDVAQRLVACGHSTSIELISTTGDRVVDRTFTEVGAFGVFVREIETALQDGRVDVAVHSYKDLPTDSPADLVIAAVPERVDAADILLAPSRVLTGDGLIPLEPGARVGTASARRRALLQHYRPDLVIDLLRGNVPTRLRAVTEGRFDAIVLAAAGLYRLQRSGAELPSFERADVVVTRLDPSQFVPAPSQGAVAVQVRRDDTATRTAVAAIDDARTTRALAAERGALARAEAGCSLPFGAWCQVRDDDTLSLLAVLADEQGNLRRAAGAGHDPDELADTVWRQLALGRGA
ncbi:MAG: hydroxymethylbilane synthase [Gemmatimonadetes bacterium]|nr:hydroxymethylbilane synthase [Gemmatimonadota bacterium]